MNFCKKSLNFITIVFKASFKNWYFSVMVIFFIINNCTKNVPLHIELHGPDHRGTSSPTDASEVLGLCCLFACLEVLRGVRLPLHHLLPPLQPGRLHVGFWTAWLVRSRRLPPGFEQLFWPPVQTKRARARGGVVHDAGWGVNGRRGWGQPRRPVVVLGETDRLQGPQRCAVATVRRGCWWGEGQGVVVVERKMGEVRREEGVRQGGGRWCAAHQESSQGVDKRVRPR